MVSYNKVLSVPSDLPTDLKGSLDTILLSSPPFVTQNCAKDLGSMNEMESVSKQTNSLILNRII